MSVIVGEALKCVGQGHQDVDGFFGYFFPVLVFLREDSDPQSNGWTSIVIEDCSFDRGSSLQPHSDRDCLVACHLDADGLRIEVLSLLRSHWGAARGRGEG